MKNGKYNTTFHQKVPGKILLCARARPARETSDKYCTHHRSTSSNHPFSNMDADTNNLPPLELGKAFEIDLNTLEPVMDDNSINNTVTAADRMDHYIDMEVKGTGRRPTYKQLEAASKQQKSEPFPRIMMLDYQNEENEQARLASINNAGSPRPRQNTPEIEKVSADNCLSMDPPTENNKTRRTTSSRTST